VVIHEAPLTAGFGAEVVATIVEEAFASLSAPVLRVAAPDAPYPMSSLEREYLPSAERAFGAIRRVMGAG
jgi:pyruvate dehydrogenase E1 component beta subunit